MEWVRGAEIGRGSFSTVNLAIPTKCSAEIPPLMVAKSSESETAFSSTLQNEKKVFDELGISPQIIKCFGDESRVEKGKKLYNLLLEYASGGSLDNLRRNRSFTESEIRRFTKTILKGISYIHSKGFVHCDIKLQNIVVFDDGNVKIADFGLAKRAGEKKQSNEDFRFQLRGTPLYMAPESVNNEEFESPVDIWALGCAVVEMVTGESAWKVSPKSNVASLLIRIGVGEEFPQVPEEFSEEGKDFLGKCFLKDPGRRWTADMLLKHPFVAAVEEDDDNGDEFSTSPRCPFQFLELLSVSTSSPPELSPESGILIGRERNPFSDTSSLECFPSPVDRIRQLATEELPDWSDSERWVSIR